MSEKLNVYREIQLDTIKSIKRLTVECATRGDSASVELNCINGLLLRAILDTLVCIGEDLEKNE